MSKRGFPTFVALLSFILTFVLAEFVLAPGFQRCIYTYLDTEAGNQSNYKYSDASIRIESVLHCAGHIFNRYSNGIAALATAIIALFTIILWTTSNRQATLAQDALTETRRAADAAKKSADDAILSNSPHLLAEAWGVGPLGPDEITLVVFKIRKYGLTLARITDYKAKVIFKEDGSGDVGLPLEPDFTSVFAKHWETAKGLIVPPQESIPRTEFFEDTILGDRFKILRRGAGSIVVFGVVEFEGNLPESGGTMAFSAELRKGDPQEWTWLPDAGSPAYHYYRRKNEKKGSNSMLKPL